MKSVISFADSLMQIVANQESRPSSCSRDRLLVDVIHDWESAWVSEPLAPLSTRKDVDFDVVLDCLMLQGRWTNFIVTDCWDIVTTDLISWLVGNFERVTPPARTFLRFVELMEEPPVVLRFGKRSDLTPEFLERTYGVLGSLDQLVVLKWLIEKNDQNYHSWFTLFIEKTCLPLGTVGNDLCELISAIPLGNTECSNAKLLRLLDLLISTL